MILFEVIYTHITCGQAYSKIKNMPKNLYFAFLTQHKISKQERYSSQMSAYSFQNNLESQRSLGYRSSNVSCIQEMFRQVNYDLAKFLKNLNFIFHSHGINFDVTQHHNVLLRIITPFQLLQHFKIRNAADMLDSRYATNNDTRNVQQRKNVIKKNKYEQKNTSKYQESKSMPRTKRNQPVEQSPQVSGQLASQFTHNRDRDQEQQDAQNYIQINNNSQIIYRKPTLHRMIKNTNKAMLDTDEELKVHRFIQVQVQKGTRLSMRHIADKAKLIAKNSRNSHKFQGSIGWVRHFLRRYPKMRKLYDKSRAQAKPNYPNSYYQRKLRKQQQKQNQVNSNKIDKYYRPHEDGTLEQIHRKKVFLDEQGMENGSESSRYESEDYSNFGEQEGDYQQSQQKTLLQQKENRKQQNGMNDQAPKRQISKKSGYKKQEQRQESQQQQQRKLQSYMRYDKNR